MAKKPLPADLRRAFGMAVVGLSGTDKDKGVTGVGKSCLCSRFLHPHADEYQTTHISVLSQSDFGGRVVNNDHFLYWGHAKRMSEDGTTYDFEVVEHTEFLDDNSYQSIGLVSKTDPYHKRCAAAKLTSAEKLAYICKDQLGLEHEFDEHLMPDGKLNIDGFLCVFDVSLVEQRNIHQQMDRTGQILSSLIKTKKPIVLVTTKNDIVHEPYLNQAEKWLNSRKDQKGSLIPVVETSAHENVNVDVAFLILAQLLDKSVKVRTKALPYAEASKANTDAKAALIDRNINLLKATVHDYRCSWTAVKRQLGDMNDFKHFVEMFGTAEAKKNFNEHIDTLLYELIDRTAELLKERLAAFLAEKFTEIDGMTERSWPSIVQNTLPLMPYYKDWFVTLENGRSWTDPDFIESNDRRFPKDWLLTSEADMTFRVHVNRLRAVFRQNECKREFKKLLEDSPTVCAGKPFSDSDIFFVGEECYSQLTENDKLGIYEEFQKVLQANVKAGFLELLQEKAERLMPLLSITVSQEDVDLIVDELKDDPRCNAMRFMQTEREHILKTHIGFIQSPSPERCPYAEHCTDHEAMNVLRHKARRPQSWNRSTEFLIQDEDNSLNLVILGAQGLSQRLQKEIKALCQDDEYILNGIDGTKIYTLNVRPISGNVTLPDNALSTALFQPHGCLCVYNSISTYGYLEESLEKVLICDKGGGRLRGLPLVLVLAHNPGLTSTLDQLRDMGQSLASRFQCEFIDVPSSMMEGRQDLCDSDQISLAMHKLNLVMRDRYSIVRDGGITESLEPHIRLLMCHMCGDPYDLELPLSPLLNHQCCYTPQDNLPTVALETFLGDSKRKLEVVIVSYHQATKVKNELFHGFILVYSPKRLASLANLKAFAKLLPVNVPIKILAVCENTSEFFTDQKIQSMLVSGEKAADEIATKKLIKVGFMTTSAKFNTQTASFAPFFGECWQMKDSTENQFPSFVRLNTETHDPFNTVGKHSTDSSNMADGEPIYDQPYARGWATSDSDQDSLPRNAPYAATNLFPDSTISNGMGDDIANYQVPNSHDKPRLLQYDSSPNGTARGGAITSRLNTHNRIQPLAGRLEIASDYGIVKDALLPPPESDYAEVVDCLPEGQLHRIRSSHRYPVRSTSPSEGYEEAVEGSQKKSKYRLRRKDKVKPLPTPEQEVALLNQGYYPDEDWDPLDLAITKTPGTVDETSEISRSRWRFMKPFSTSDRKKQKDQLKAPKNKRSSKSPGGSAGSSSSSSLSRLLDDVHVDGGVPSIVLAAVQFIEAHGLDVEGLYRIPGNKAQADVLLQKLRENGGTDIASMGPNVTTVTTALKQYLAELQEPLIPIGLRSQMVDAMNVTGGMQDQISGVKAALRRMPQSNLLVLGYLAGHLHRVAEHSHANRMTAENLSLCWWPTLLQSTFSTMDEFTSQAKSWETLVAFIIENHPVLFPVN